MIEIIPEMEITSIIIDLKTLTKVERKHYKISDDFFWHEFWSGDKVTGSKSVEPLESMWPDAIEHILYMQKVRDYLGFGVRYNSAYRTPSWNKIWKGAENSRHLYCLAGDMFPLKRMTMKKFGMIINMLTPYNQYGVYNRYRLSSGWVHAGSVTNSILYKW